jgi:hypothetical protein
MTLADIYVANDFTASALYQNKHNGKFVDIGMESGCSLSADGKPQAGWAFWPGTTIWTGHRQNKFCGTHRRCTAI